MSKWFTNKAAANAEAKTHRKEVGREGLAFGVLGEGEKAAVEFWRGFMAEFADTSPPRRKTWLPCKPPSHPPPHRKTKPKTKPPDKTDRLLDILPSCCQIDNR